MKIFGVSAFSSAAGATGAAGAGATGAAAKAAGISAAAARIGSGLFNFEVNRRWSFRSKGHAGREAVRYFVLFGANMACNAGMVTAFSYTGMPAALGKVIADVTLFIVNYYIQKHWVFRAPCRQ